MEKNPYTFSSQNRRMVENADRPSMVMYGAVAFFGLSMHLYNRRFFRVDQNMLNFMVFAGASLPASYTYSSFLFSSPEIEAGIINNQHETQH